MWATRRLLRGFAVNRLFTKNLDNVGSKIRTRTAAADMGKLQSFLEDSMTRGTIREKIANKGPSDEEFNRFLQGFRDKNKEYANILDLSRFYDESNTLNTKEKLREDELEMLREFQKRALERKQEEVKHKEDRGFMYESGDHMFSRNHTFHPMNYGRNSQFMHIIMTRGVTTQVTTLNRVNHFRYLVFGGNSDGIIGYGKGKGIDFESALLGALKDLKRNMIALDMRPENTFPLKINTKFCRYFMKIEPTYSYQSWGNPLFSTMVQLSGAENVRFNMNKRNQNYFNQLYAYMKIMASNKSIPTLAELHGVRPFQLGLTKGYNQLHTTFKKFV